MDKKKADSVINVLNEILESELTAVNQYFIHHKLSKHWGYEKIQTETRKHSIEEMKHVELILDRILFLGGSPDVRKLEKVKIGQTSKEQFQFDQKLEEEAIKRLNSAISYCENKEDHGTKILLENILKSEERHLEWLNSQINLLSTLGESTYLSTKI